MAIKLINNGERTIINGDFHFKPKQIANFTPETGAKLLALYKGEVLAMDDIVAEAEIATEPSAGDEAAGEEAQVAEAPASKPTKSKK